MPPRQEKTDEEQSQRELNMPGPRTSQMLGEDEATKQIQEAAPDSRKAMNKTPTNRSKET